MSQNKFMLSILAVIVLALSARHGMTAVPYEVNRGGRDRRQRLACPRRLGRITGGRSGSAGRTIASREVPFECSEVLGILYSHFNPGYILSIQSHPTHIFSQGRFDTQFSWLRPERCRRGSKPSGRRRDSACLQSLKVLAQARQLDECVGRPP